MEYLIAAFILFGSAFSVVAALGLLRFPDTLCRLHAATKAGAFGATLLLIAASLFFRQWIVYIEAVLIVTFFYTTAPIAAHLLGRVLATEEKVDSPKR